MKLFITKPTKKQEIHHLKTLIKDNEFFIQDNNNGYGIDWPLNIKDFKYNPFIYDRILNEVKKMRKSIKIMIKQIEREVKNYKPFEVYEIRLTANGPGGEYYEEGNRGVVLIKYNAQNLFDLIIHELIHLGVEHIVSQKEFTQDEKEKMVEDIHYRIDKKGALRLNEYKS